MQLHDIMQSNAVDVFITLLDECSQFIGLSGGQPMRKFLPETYNDIHRVKVRKKQRRDQFSSAFNEAFDEEIHQIRQRAIFANGTQEAETDQESFLIFPPDGFKFLYCAEVSNSSRQYRSVFESILDVDDGDTFKELLKFAYTSENLAEGLEANAEIIIYNVPYFYAVRESVHSYEDVLSSIGEK